MLNGSSQSTANTQLDGHLGPLDSWPKAAHGGYFIIPLFLRVHSDVLFFLPDPLGHFIYGS